MGKQKNLDCLILENLRGQDSYISGEELARKLKISRQALWKHINSLSHKGYDIVAVPHSGYKIISTPDKFYPWEVQRDLNTEFIAREVYFYESLNSTQDSSRELGLSGASDGTVVLTDVQTKGRGRMGRSWISPKGGIYFSLLLRPEFLLLEETPQISLLIALGCVKGIKEATGLDVEVKWPNDLIFKGKKLGGILCEINAETDRVHFVVVGVGININSRDLPPEATSLLLGTGKKFRRLDIARKILQAIEAGYLKAQKRNFSAVLKEWSRFCMLWGKRVRVKISNRTIEGEAVNIDERGYLLLRQDNGFIERVSAGDIVKVIPVREGFL